MDWHGRSRTTISSSRPKAQASVLVAPAFAGGAAGDGAAPLGTERRGAGRTALEAAQPPERGRVRVERDRAGPPGQDLDALGRRVAARTGRADRLDGLGLLGLFQVLADQTAAADGEHRLD